MCSLQAHRGADPRSQPVKAADLPCQHRRRLSVPLGIGALPFLLPLLLQIGFHLTPFQSGLITFTTALGSMFMKAAVAGVLNRYGYRNVLIYNALISSAFLAACAGFLPGVPYAAMIVILLSGGFFRSLQFTSINTIAYAEVEPRRISRATTMVAAAQQLALSTGVAVGALVVEITLRLKDSATMGMMDFPPAFLIVSLLSASAALIFMQLPTDAGSSSPTRKYDAVEKKSLAARVMAKAARQQIELGGIGPACRRFDVLDVFEVALEFGKQRGFGSALQNLAQKRTALGQHLAGEFDRRLRKRHDAQMVGRPMAGGVRRHIGEDDVGIAAEHFFETIRRGVVEKVEFEEFDPGHRLEFENIERDHPPLGADALERNLAPAAGRRAEIDHAGAFLEQMIFVVDFGELIGRARTKTVALGTRHIGIAELAFEPSP